MLPRERPVWIIGRLRDPGRAVQLTLGIGHRSMAKTRLETKCTSQPALPALFGARRIALLEDLRNSYLDAPELQDRLQDLGYPSPALPKGREAVYAETRRAHGEEALKALLVRESLAFGIASSETGFVAVREEAGERIEGSVVIPNAAPHGWSPAFRTGAVLFNARSAFSVSARSSSRAVGDATRHRSSSSAPPASGPYVDRSVDLNLPSPAPVSSFGMRSGGRTVRPVRDVVIWEGPPTFFGTEAVLIDEAGGWTLNGSRNVSELLVSFPDGTPKEVDAGLVLEVFVGDLVTPRARVRLRDLLRQGGRRPLNLTWEAQDPVRIVLKNPAREWRDGAPPIVLRLRS
jgi:Ca-activated chloride channel homolog